MSNEPERYTLTLQAVPNWGTPGVQRLRAALKCLLRSFGLRCVNLAEERKTVPTRDKSDCCPADRATEKDPSIPQNLAGPS